MNSYIFDFFITHSIVILLKQAHSTLWTATIKRIKKIVRESSTTQIASNWWWTDFSTWEDFSGILLTDAIDQEINSQLELLENNTSYM
jgi:hypothetical protein